MSEQPLTDRELRYLTVLARWLLEPGPRGELCLECRAYGPDRITIHHAIGCVFHGLPRDVVTAISADWTPA